MRAAQPWLPIVLTLVASCSSPGGGGTNGDVAPVDGAGGQDATSETAVNETSGGETSAETSGDGTSPGDTTAGDTTLLDTTPLDTTPEVEVIPGACVAGTRTCNAAGTGWHGSGLDGAGEDEALASGRFVPCLPDHPCAGGACVNPSCRPAEVMLVVDRSSSMLVNDAWTWAKEQIRRVLSAHDQRNLFGLRQFPFGDACGVGAILPLQPSAVDLVGELDTPEATAATPLAAALEGLETSFGDPNDGEAVLLLSDGDETCGTADDAIAAASRLFHRGIRVYVIAVTTTANKDLLDRIAAHGGTGASRLAKDGPELYAAMNAALLDLEACRECSSDDIPRCDGDVVVRCDPELGSVERVDCVGEGGFCHPDTERCTARVGGACGSGEGELPCESGDVCFESTCCARACEGLQCGDDGCGGSCGACAFGDCVAGRCVCEPDCAGRQCGSDGCGGSCGTCTGANMECNGQGQCALAAACDGITFEGCCTFLGTYLIYCKDGALETVDCGNSYCGWSGPNGYDCIDSPLPDPSGQFPYECPPQ